MQHGVAVLETLPRDRAGLPVWDAAAVAGEEVTICAEARLWDQRPVESIPHPVGAVTTGHFTREFARSAPESRDEFAQLCGACLRYEYFALAAPTSTPDAELARVLGLLLSRWGILNETLIGRRRSVKRVFHSVDSTSPWLYVVCPFSEIPPCFFLSDSLEAVERVLTEVRQLATVRFLESW